MYDKRIKGLFIAIAVLLLIGFGVTLAYFTSSTNFENLFQTALYQTEATETFTSPDNWLPGDTTPKELTITNTGNVDVKARVCITEEWESDNGDTLDNEVNGERVAILNLANTSDWTKKGKCYEYNDVLEPNDETSSFIESVTFNPNIEANIICTTSGNTKTCTSSGDGYDNATYTLTLKVETIQANAYDELWSAKTLYSAVMYGNVIIDEPYRYDCNYCTFYNNSEELRNDKGVYIYLKHVLYSDFVTENYVTFYVSDEMAVQNPGMIAGEYSIRGGGATYTNKYNNDSIYYDGNKTIALSAFSSTYCSENEYGFNCEIDHLKLHVGKDGTVNAAASIYWECYVYPIGYARCPDV